MKNAIHIIIISAALATLAYAEDEPVVPVNSNRPSASQLEQRTVYDSETQRYETRYVAREWSNQTGRSVPTYNYAGGGVYRTAGDATLTAPGFVPPNQAPTTNSPTHTIPTTAPAQNEMLSAQATPSPQAVQSQPGTTDYALKNYTPGVVTTKNGDRYNVLVDPVSGQAYFRSNVAESLPGTSLKSLGTPITGTSMRNAGATYSPGGDPTIK